MTMCGRPWAAHSVNMAATEEAAVRAVDCASAHVNACVVVYAVAVTTRGLPLLIHSREAALLAA